MLHQIQQIAPKAHVVIRSRYEIHTAELQSGGDHVVIGDGEEVGEALAEHLSGWLESSER